MPMLKHSLKLVKAAVQKLNEGQIAVVAADQPLYALLKQIQWKFPDYNEQNFVIMFGGLHIEIAFFLWWASC